MREDFTESFCTCLCLLNPESHGFKEGIKQNEGHELKGKHQTQFVINIGSTSDTVFPQL